MFGSISSRYNSLDDATLVQRYQKTGDLEYLGVVYHRSMHLVYGISLRYLKDPEQSKDAVMQIFELLVEKLRQHQVANFKSWLYVVSKNHCLGLIRRQVAAPEADHLFMELEVNMHLNGEHEDHHLQDLSQALASLSEHQRQCIKLFFYENKSYQEIADETGYQLNRVKSYIQNGKRNLKIYLNKNEG